MPNTQTRLELSRRLHDGLAQDLAALGYSLDSIIGDSSLPDHLRAQLRSARIELSAINANFRDEIYRIRLVDRASLRLEIDELLLGTDSRLELSYPALSPQEEDAIAHILIEIIQNALVHGGASFIKLDWTSLPSTLEINVSDNGAKRRITEGNEREKHFGVIGIAEWASSINSTLTYREKSDENIHRLEIPFHENAQ